MKEIAREEIEYSVRRVLSMFLGENIMTIESEEALSDLDTEIDSIIEIQILPESSLTVLLPVSATGTLTIKKRLRYLQGF